MNGSLGTLGYRLFVPVEWHKIPVQRGSERAVDALLDEAFASHGRDQVARYRRVLRQRLMSMVREARQNAGVDLYLPLGHRETNLPASFLMSCVGLGEAQAPASTEVIAQLLATTPGARPAELGGISAVRSERICPADASRGIDHASHRVEYILPAPGTGNHWLVASFSTFGDDDPEGQTALLLCALFDAIMATFRWTSAEEDS